MGGRAGIGGTTPPAGSGGTTGIGGASGGPDASVDAASLRDGGKVDGFTQRDTGVPSADGRFAPDAGSDLKPEDAWVPDAYVPCVAQIVPVVPTANWLGSLFSGPNTQVVLRATVQSGGPRAGASWNWQATWQGIPLAEAALGRQDPAAAVFAIANPGEYTFLAWDSTSTCRTTVLRATARAPNGCPKCDSYVGLRAAPPLNDNVPVQFGFHRLLGKPPFPDPAVVLANGVAVRVVPNVAGGSVSSYVRISHSDGELVADGYADSNPTATPGFNTWLLAVDPYGAILRYDVLVVPLDGPDGGAVAATAPQLFRSLATDAINVLSFALSGGVKVTGSTTTADGRPVVDARVVLSNQDPAQKTAPSQLLFSSVGRSDTQGSFVLNVQPGTYWVSISPPPGAGLGELLAPGSVTLTADTTLDFRWDVPVTAALTLKATDLSGAPLAGTRVRVVSRQRSRVGTMTVRSGSGTLLTQDANGTVEVHGTTSVTGVVSLPNLIANRTYDVVLVPASPGPLAGTTNLTVELGEEAKSETVKLLGESRISGRLLASPIGGKASAPDWTQVQVIAYDKSDDMPEPPQAVAVSADGTFSLWVTPSRPYVLLAVPPVDSGWVRTFVGPGALGASEFLITQKLQASMDWITTVRDESGRGLSGTSLQVFCKETWANCHDPSIPLAETTAGEGGVFHLALPDPATR